MAPFSMVQSYQSNGAVLTNLINKTIDGLLSQPNQKSSNLKPQSLVAK
jgi:hypothetical protein